MSRNPNNSHSPNDFFSRQALEFSFRLLRNNKPGLANAIKKALDQLEVVPYETLQKAHTGEMYFNAQLFEILNAHTIGMIVSSLTEIGIIALHDHRLPAVHSNMLRNVIDDWVQLTEWILSATLSDKSYLSINARLQ
jgi:hypothetical protein